MNATHRGLNRLLLGLLGLVLVGVGALIGAAGLNTSIAEGWNTTGATLLADLSHALASAPIPGSSISWWTIAVLALALVVMALLLGWIASQGGGRTNRAGRREDPEHPGTTTVETSLASAAVRKATVGDDRIIAATVSTWKAKRADGLKLTLQARKGVSPRDLADTGEELISGLDNLLGDRGPVLIRITTGLRSTLSSTDRVR
ncbi:hypothetical protein [Pseudarthrobacter sp. PH31-O2]|uniref:hypothetical protein n=1 Tax=Pseudarthrobacter sp. PH31-O2 TaxID=3046206 RepID=UPI0024B87E28|nr:hypothetical protein [Pseudarthrobacter sp. PH31-O2]MDJ0354305.1 hypothetical protein [Pseudarthrobacter sp. PH31-O2]